MLISSLVPPLWYNVMFFIEYYIFKKKSIKILRFLNSQTFQMCIIENVIHHSILFIVNPMILIYNFGIIRGILLYILPRLTHGVYFHVFTQISHINHDSFVNKNLNHSKNFIVHQILSTSDYASDSRLHGYISCGINNQALHHVVPNLHPCHSPKLSKVFQQFCNKYKINRSVHDDFIQAFNAHFNHVARVNVKAKENYNKKMIESNN